MMVKLLYRIALKVLAAGAALLIGSGCGQSPNSISSSHCVIDYKQIVSWADFHELAPTQYPYVARHAGCAKMLVYVAARHTSDPDSKTFQLVEDQFTLYRFDRVILEGFVTTLGENPESMIALANTVHGTIKDTEAMLAIREAIAMNTVFVGGEANDLELDKVLSPQGFDRRDQFYYYCLRAIEGWVRSGQVVDHTDPQLSQNIKTLAKTLSPPMQTALLNQNVDLSLDGLAKWYGEMNGLTYQTAFRFSDAYFTDAALSRGSNRLAIGVADARDRHIVKLIDDTLHRHDRVLVVYGGSHHRVQKLALEAGYPQ